MAVVDIQRRMRSLGKIRMGDRGTKGQPQRLTEFRLTSPSRQLIEAAAAAYGGDVRQWEGAPDGEQWEVYTETAQLPIAIPPADEPYSQHYELWSGAGCQRRCDGRTAMVATDKQGMRERACVCDPDERECKLTTRASVMLPDIPGIGVWTIESHGYNAAVELTGTLAFLGRAASQGVYVEAVLRLEQRSKRVPGQPVSRFVVPVIDTPELGVGQIMAGGGAQALPTGEPPPAPRGRPAIPAGDATPTLPARAQMDDPAPEEASSGEPGWGSTPTPPSGEAARRALRSDEPDERPITKPQQKRLFAIRSDSGMPEDELRALIKSVTGDESSESITRGQYEDICSRVEAWETPAP